jgi:hypothetical protein
METEIKIAIISAIALILAAAMQILGPVFINSGANENTAIPSEPPDYVQELVVSHNPGNENAAISSESSDYSTHINITNNQEVISQGYVYAARNN